MSESKELTDDDKTHIARLQYLQGTGNYNMFTEFYAGMKENYELGKAEATYEWVKDNWEYFQSGDWRSVEVEHNG